MPAPQQSADELLAQVRKKHWIGRFRVATQQSSTHPDQRPLDEAWVDELANKIGNKANLNQALYPIGVILEDDGSKDELRALAGQSHEGVPSLPGQHKVLVFAGQHRLAALPRLGVDKEEDLWWHADVYATALQSEQPAEFLTMMHESNVPTIMKASSDVDLFRAIVKLKAFYDAGAVKKHAFLLNRQALLGHNVNTSRAICTLTRNNQLADAVSEALSRPHIAKTFNAGAWRRIATGRMWGVASGLLREMICQVDLLTRGMVDVPEGVLTLRPRSCQWSQLEAHMNRKKNQGHPWDALPGKLGGALERVRRRPVDFVTPLNPKTNDGWSFTDMVSEACHCSPTVLRGLWVVEEQLKVMQTVMSHLLRVCADPVHFSAYMSTSSESIEANTDHPAGMIAHVLAAQRKDSSKVAGYEQKIIHFVWANRDVLSQGLTAAQIAGPLETEADDYSRLINTSQHWWQLFRMFKTHRFPFGWRLGVPKEFGAALSQDSLLPTQSSTRGSQEVMEGSAPLVQLDDQQPGLPEPSLSASKKRPRSRSSADTDEPARMDQPEEATSTKKAPCKKRVKPYSAEVLPDDTDEEMDRPDEESSAALPPRQGGDRQLGRTLADLEALAKHLTRPESQGLTCLLRHILSAHKQGTLGQVVDVLNEQASTLLGAEDMNKESEVSVWPKDSAAGSDDEEEGSVEESS
ncbi:hypothetical protein RhiJN_11745 [Ceratobasidium sp. AG-Ba]|nr:hypothetical protein RhiJN_11745 [Ceratobasidium sp. AG-Ba]